MTAVQRDSIKNGLMALPEVRKPEYETQRMAYERFRADSKSPPGFVEFTKPPR